MVQRTSQPKAIRIHCSFFYGKLFLVDTLKTSGAITQIMPTKARKRVCYVLYQFNLEEKKSVIYLFDYALFVFKWNWYKRHNKHALSFFGHVSSERAFRESWFEIEECICALRVNVSQPLTRIAQVVHQLVWGSE